MRITTFDWGYNPDDPVKKYEEVIRALSGCVCGDGNLLLNVGPLPTGEIPPEQVAVLEKVGSWVKVNGEGIYGTTGGPYTPGSWGGSTHKDNKIYLHLYEPYEGKFAFPGLKKKVVKSYALNGAGVKLDITEEAIVIEIDEAKRHPVCTVVVLELDGPAGDIPVIEMPMRPYAFKLKYGTWLSTKDQSRKVEPSFTLSSVSTRKYDKHKQINKGERIVYFLSDGITKKDYMLATEPELNPHVIVDLQRSAQIKLVEVENAKGEHGEANKDLTVWVSGDEQNWVEFGKAEGLQEQWDFKNASGVKGRYVKVGLVGDTKRRLCMMRMKVFGEPENIENRKMKKEKE